MPVPMLRTPPHVISVIPSDVGFALPLSPDDFLAEPFMIGRRLMFFAKPLTTVEPLRVSPPEAVAFLRPRVFLDT